MEEALAEAKAAAASGEVPVGAVVVVGDQIVSRAHNEVEKLQDASAHAELLALQRASATLGEWRLSECSIFVTMEPCPMCIGAILLSRLKELYFGCYDPVMGAVGSVFDLSSHPGLPRAVKVFHGLLEKESESLVKQFFSERRNG